MRIYNKLVRDKIPQIIAQKSEQAIIHTLSDEEAMKEFNKKLLEETNEYLEENNVEELADIVEVIYGILKLKNIDLPEFEDIRLKKVEQRGAFDKKIFLEKVVEVGDFLL